MGGLCNMNVKIILTLLVIASSIAIPVFSHERPGEIRNDSLRKEVAMHTGAKRVSAQIELVLNIIESEKEEAKTIAESALKEALSLNDQHLLMRAYYINGKINELSHKNELAVTQYNSALAIAESLNDHWHIGEILLRKGLIKNGQGEDIEALKLINSSIQASRLSGNFRVMGLAYSIMGTIFRLNGLYDRAIEYTIISRINYEKAGFTEGNAWSSYVLGRIYSDMKLPQKAMDNYNKSLEIYLKLSSVDGNKSGIALCYEQIGLLHLNSGKYTEAYEYIKKTLDIYKEKQSDFGISNSHKHMGMIEYYLGNYDLAEKYLNLALTEKNNIGDQLSLPTIYEFQGLCAIGRGNVNEGLSKMNKGLEIAIKNNQKKIQLEIYSKLTDVYLKNNDLKNALICQKKQIEVQDLIQSGSADIKVEQLQAIYEIEKKNSQIIELEKQNEINKILFKEHRISEIIMIAGIVIAIFISIVIYWLYTKIRQMNYRLREANAAKDKLFALIAHDLRGPTGNLKVFLEYLNDSFDEFSQAELKSLLNTLTKSADSVSVLLDNLLFWAKSQLNKIEYQPVEINLSDIIYLSIKGHRQIAADKKIKVEFLMDDQILIYADSNMVQTIIRNIFNNAIKFTPRGGNILIKTSYYNSSQACVTITDNGIGIEKSYIDGLFEINNTYRKAGTENEKSTGLGLFLVKDFVEKNKGAISIDSDAGVGTSVSFTLPLANKNL